MWKSVFVLILGEVCFKKSRETKTGHKKNELSGELLRLVDIIY